MTRRTFAGWAIFQGARLIGEDRRLGLADDVDGVGLVAAKAVVVRLVLADIEGDAATLPARKDEHVAEQGDALRAEGPSSPSCAPRARSLR